MVPWQAEDANGHRSWVPAERSVRDVDVPVIFSLILRARAFRIQTCVRSRYRFIQISKLLCFVTSIHGTGTGMLVLEKFNLTRVAHGLAGRMGVDDHSLIGLPHQSFCLSDVGWAPSLEDVHLIRVSSLCIVVGGTVHPVRRGIRISREFGLHRQV